jgi:predicted GIY-YIG superfamily endonuclease
MTATHVLYRMFDRDGGLLYVGITNDPKVRFRTHSRSQPWWDQVANITVQNHTSREALADAEQKAIRTESPLYNVALRPIAVPPPARPAPRCPTCRAPEPSQVPLDEWEFLHEDGQFRPMCTDPYHHPEDPELAEKFHRNRQLLRQAGLLRLTAIAEERMKRNREAMSVLEQLIPWTPKEASA